MQKNIKIRILANGGQGPQDFTRPAQSFADLLPGMFTPADLGIGTNHSRDRSNNH